MKSFVALTVALVAVGTLAGAEQHGVPARHVYSTWQYVELDKAASTWLIKRFVDKRAMFRVFRKGTLIRVGIPFDTPDSKLRRERNATTFEAIQRRYGLRDPALDYMAKIVWDIEINVWDKKTTSEAKGVNAVILGMARISRNEVQCFQKSWPVFDALYAEVRARR